MEKILMTLCFYRCPRNFVCRYLQNWFIPHNIFAFIFLRPRFSASGKSFSLNLNHL